MYSNWPYFLGLTLILTSLDVGLLQRRGLVRAGCFFGPLQSALAALAFVAGFIVGPWWGTLVAFLAYTAIGIFKLLALDFLSKGEAEDEVIMLRVFLAWLGQVAGVVCIAYWFFR